MTAILMRIYPRARNECIRFLNANAERISEVSGGPGARQVPKGAIQPVWAIPSADFAGPTRIADATRITRIAHGTRITRIAHGTRITRITHGTRITRITHGTRPA